MCGKLSQKTRKQQSHWHEYESAGPTSSSMLLTYLSLTNFRNFIRLETEFNAGSTLLVGANAQGKTSLLEAVYYLSCAYSPHTYQDRQLINLLALDDPLPVARIVAEIHSDRADPHAGITISSIAVEDQIDASDSPSSAPRGESLHRIEIRLILEASANQEERRFRKEILLNGVKRRVADLPGIFPAVLFLPKDMRIIEGSPFERRRLLDDALLQAEPAYFPLHSEYGKVLTQRNALLKQMQDRKEEEDQLQFWDDKLSELAAQIIHRRALAITELERFADPIHRELSGGIETLRIAYLPAYDPLTGSTGQLDLPLEAQTDWHNLRLEIIQEGMASALRELRTKEILRGQTLIGPHRDELAFKTNGIDLRFYGSRGQNRTAMLAFKLAEVEWLYERTHKKPILLLDEVMAELDRDRRNQLMERVQRARQSILTTADIETYGEDFCRDAVLWRIEAGRLIQGTD